MATPESIERRVQLAGNSTYVVSLPKEWATDQGLTAGASMHLYPHADRLIAAPEPTAETTQAVTIEASGHTPATVARAVRRAYAIGVDDITVTGLGEADDRCRYTLERTVGELLGVAIQGGDDDALVVTDVLDPTEVSLPQTLTQLRQSVRALVDTALTALTTDEPASTTGVERAGDVDRLVVFVERTVHRGLAHVTEINRLGTDRREAFRIYRIVRGLGEIAEEARRITALAAGRTDGSSDTATQLAAVATELRSMTDRAGSDDLDDFIDRADTCRDHLEQLDEGFAATEHPDGYRYGQLRGALDRLLEWLLAVATIDTEPTAQP